MKQNRIACLFRRLIIILLLAIGIILLLDWPNFIAWRAIFYCLLGIILLLVRHNRIACFIVRHNRIACLIVRHNRIAHLIVRHNRIACLIVRHNRIACLIVRHNRIARLIEAQSCDAYYENEDNSRNTLFSRP